MCVKKNNKKEIDLVNVIAFYLIIAVVVSGIIASCCCNC